MGANEARDVQVGQEESLVHRKTSQVLEQVALVLLHP